MWGNIGVADRLDFTAIGPAVNLVSWLEGLCRPLDKVVLVSDTFAAETGVSLIPLGTHALRGIVSPCAIFTVPENRADRVPKHGRFLAQGGHRGS
jgi:adenylate cyclase